MAKRLHQLDSLRGIAAFSVMLSHLFLVFPIVWDTARPNGSPWWLKATLFSPLRAVWAGHEAVVFFFILSGFVLALLYLGEKPPPYRLYLAKRILRIYPPYLVAALAAIVLRELLFHGPVPAVSAWFNQSWRMPASAGSITNHILMIGSFSNCDFNPVLWSLVHEMRISIIFPLIIWTIVQHGRLSVLLPALLTFIYCLAINLRYRGIFDFNHDYFATLHYTGFFFVGAYLAKNRERLTGFATGISRRLKWCLLSLALLAYTNAFWLPSYLPIRFHYAALLTSKVWFQEWITSAGVVVFILLALSSKAASGFLAARPLVFLGSISYSLYLFHAIVLKAVITEFGQTLPLAANLALTVFFAILVSTASWRWIELPSIKLGKYLTKRWHQKRWSLRSSVTETD